MNAPDSDPALLAGLVQLIADAQTDSTSIKPGDVFAMLKVLTLVILFGWMNSLRATKRRQIARIQRRYPRKHERSRRIKVNLNTRRGSGSKPQGGRS